MDNKSQKIKPLISLDVEKHNNTAHAIVAGEATGSLVFKGLKKLDKCNYVWTNGEMNTVSESAGLLIAALPFLGLTTVGSAISSAVLKPLGRLVGFKGLRCKKRKDKDDEEEDCPSEPSESEDEESEDEESEDEHCDTEDSDAEELSDDEHCDTEDSDAEDNGCKKNDSKKKQNWLSKFWGKVYKNRK